jgi:hypothetical protein
MKRLVLSAVGLLALFSILRANSQEPTRRLVVNPGLLELSAQDAGASVGFATVEEAGDRNQTWTVFPLRIALRSGNERFAIALSGLDLLARRGVSFARPVTVPDVHRGDLVSIGGPVIVTGTVEGSVWVLGADAVVRAAAKVDHDVVSLGGKVTVERGATVGGNTQSLPAVRIPFLGLVTSRQSVETLQFVIELFGIGITLIVLFLILHFRLSYLGRQAAVVSSAWQSNLLYLFLGLILGPVFVALLIASIVGLLLVPVVVLGLMITTLFGGLGVMVRLGRLIVRGGDEPLAAFGAGVVGLVLVRGPGLVGRMLAIFASDLFAAAATLLKAVSGVAVFLVILYGFGCGLTALREAGR